MVSDSTLITQLIDQLTDGLSQPPKAGYWPSVPKVAIIGGGRWGKNLIRNFYQLHALATVCDLSPSIRGDVSTTYPEVTTTDSVEAVFSDPTIDAVVIATPSHTHAPLAMQAIQSGKHVYVEKPLARTAGDVDDLIKLALAHKRLVMVGHLLLYHPKVIRLRQLVADGILGDITAIHSCRLNTNPVRPDTSVLWDLGPHDLSMMATILGMTPTKLISTHGQRVGADGKVDHARMTVAFENNRGQRVEGELVNSWVHPIKQVQLVVYGTQAIAMLDDTRPDNPLKLVSNPTATQPLPQRIDAEPDTLAIEPLAMECQHFLNCVREGDPPNTDGNHARQIVALLEEAHTHF